MSWVIPLYKNKHFTVTVFLFDEEKRTLLVKHPKLGKWLPPGGHMEPNELPTETAIREVMEEVGIEISFPTIDIQDALKISPPGHILVENLEDHNHIDLIYFVKVPYQEPKMMNEIKEASWFSLKEIEHLDTYENVKLVVKEFYSGRRH